MEEIHVGLLPEVLNRLSGRHEQKKKQNEKKRFHNEIFDASKTSWIIYGSISFRLKQPNNKPQRQK